MHDTWHVIVTSSAEISDAEILYGPTSELTFCATPPAAVGAGARATSRSLRGIHAVSRCELHEPRIRAHSRRWGDRRDAHVDPRPHRLRLGPRRCHFLTDRRARRHLPRTEQQGLRSDDVVRRRRAARSALARAFRPYRPPPRAERHRRVGRHLRRHVRRLALRWARAGEISARSDLDAI